MPATVILITGGQRSGKSSFAQKMAEDLSPSPVYLATSRIWDEEFKQRVKRHQSDRGDHWSTIEEEKRLSKHDLTGKTVVLDCITLWLTNIFHDNRYDVEPSLIEAKNEWELLCKQDFYLIVVSNEIGMGIIPENEASRKFSDLQGWMNQHIASTAQNVFLMISGIPHQIK